MARFRTLLANIDPRGRAILAGAAAAALVVVVLLLLVSSQTSPHMLMSGLDPADTGKVTAALEKQGIPYELQNGGTAVSVADEDIARARIAVSGTGMPQRGKPGFELFDEQKLGTSDFQQKVAYQRALEGAMANTIQQVDGVQGQRVQLVLADDQLFDDQRSAAKAAVLLSGDASGLQSGSVRGIAQLVASSVKGLKITNVTITDGAGTLLWPNGQDAGSTDGVAAKQAVEARYERELGADLTAMLAQTLGPGRAVVRVNADLNANRATQSRLKYDKRGTLLRKETGDERLRGSAGAAGAAGAAANIPTYPQAGAAGGNSNYTDRSEKADYAVGKTVTRTEIAPGAVNRLQVALMVDQQVPQAQLAGVRSAVAAAAGLDPARGDKVTLTSLPFAPIASPGPSSPPAGGVLPILKWVGLGLAVLLFGFFVVRHLRRQEQDGLADPDWLRELAEPVPIAELARPVVLPGSPAEERAARIREAVEQDPDRVAQQVRMWMQDDEAGDVPGRQGAR